MIEYCGDGNAVEVTGSFNGWQHRVGMELQASKSIGLVLVPTLSTSVEYLSSDDEHVKDSFNIWVMLLT